MLGSLVYIILDISFNILYWTSVKTFHGIGTLVHYLSSDNENNENDENNENNENNENDENDENNENDNDSKDNVNNKNNTNTNKNFKLSETDIITIQEQIKNQTELIKELKNKINSLENDLFINKFNKHFEKEKNEENIENK